MKRVKVLLSFIQEIQETIRPKASILGTSNSYRNSKVNSFIPSINLLLKSGFRVVRVGRDSSDKIDSRKVLYDGFLDLTEIKDVPYSVDRVGIYLQLLFLPNPVGILWQILVLENPVII